MKCPVCKTDMDQGFMDAGRWFSGKKSKGFFFITSRKVKYVVAWRCPKDGKIELISEV